MSCSIRTAIHVAILALGMGAGIGMTAWGAPTPPSIPSAPPGLRTPDATWLRQKMSFLAEDGFRTGKLEGGSRADCEFAATLIGKYSRLSEGMALKSSCRYMADVHEYILETELMLDPAMAKVGKFRKVTSRVNYRTEKSARYAASILKKLNFHECNVLFSANRAGLSVSLETVALVSARMAKAAQALTKKEAAKASAKKSARAKKTTQKSRAELQAHN